MLDLLDLVPAAWQLYQARMHLAQVMMAFINEWSAKLGVKIVCSQVGGGGCAAGTAVRCGHCTWRGHMPNGQVASLIKQPPKLFFIMYQRATLRVTIDAHNLAAVMPRLQAATVSSTYRTHSARPAC